MVGGIEPPPVKDEFGECFVVLEGASGQCGVVVKEEHDESALDLGFGVALEKMEKLLCEELGGHGHFLLRGGEGTFLSCEGN